MWKYEIIKLLDTAIVTLESSISFHCNKIEC